MTVGEFEKESVSQTVPCFCSKRWILAYVSFFGFICLYAVRVNMSVAIVCMVKSQMPNISNINNKNTTNEVVHVRCVDETELNTQNYHAEFEWDKSTQSQILASFFYGYFVMQIPGGWCAGRYGAKRVVGLGLGFSELVTVLMPVCARTRTELVYVLRVILGISSNGVLSAVPYMAMVVTSIGGGQIADFLRKRYMSTRTARSLFQSTSFVGSAACLIAVGFVPCEQRMVAVAVLTLAVAFEGLSNSGYVVNAVDFAPRYAGVLFGIQNTIATIPGMLAPLVIGGLTPHKTQGEWRDVMYLSAGFCVFGALIFGIFVKTDVEPWAVEKCSTEVEFPYTDKTPSVEKEEYTVSSINKSEQFDTRM